MAEHLMLKPPNSSEVIDILALLATGSPSIDHSAGSAIVAVGEKLSTNGTRLVSGRADRSQGVA